VEPPPAIEPRNLRFAVDAEDVPAHWHPAGAAATRFFDALSVCFPAGERFFVASVRAHLPYVRDAALREAVKAFGAQEGYHAREHVRYNARLARQGAPAEELERAVKALLRAVSHGLPPRMQLAATCALEHFTALLAHLVLADPTILAGAHPAMAELWRWHAAEEAEHKAVAFEVFRAAGGTYAERCGIMALASVIFWGKVLEHQVKMMRADGTLGSPAEWRALGRFLFVAPGALRALVRPYLAYYAPGFHPDQLDSSALIAAWKAGTDGTARGASGR
jgi:predicted metal-dependent hydrolase